MLLPRFIALELLGKAHAAFTGLTREQMKRGTPYTCTGCVRGRAKAAAKTARCGDRCVGLRSGEEQDVRFVRGVTQSHIRSVPELRRGWAPAVPRMCSTRRGTRTSGTRAGGAECCTSGGEREVPTVQGEAPQGQHSIGM